ncbi:hypothetical protein Mal4_01620 [Maioricimonas rarisocia]|uniref:Trypsin n=1 Tax=Maioricimonas rarisocia TaxID=2528026 RepID=A0A517Z070_9PLAN|nr:hypothetical protein [Maioricimonas rarisocia]QDU35880.1 hypothetical protein Mal4_01620 [Maioricimonas rarisocia]
MKQSTFALRCLLSLTLTSALFLRPGLAEESALPTTETSEAATEQTRLTDQDLSEQVEIIVRSELRSSSRTSHGVAVSLKNTSDEDLAGPIVLAVDGTGVDALKLAETDGELTDGAGYIEFIPETGTLRAGQITRSKRIEFSSEETLPLESRRAFELTARVVCPADAELAAAAGEADEVDEEDLVPGKSYTWEEVRHAMDVQIKHTPELLKHEGVVGTAIGEDPDGNLVVLLYTTRHGVVKEMPGSVGGIDLGQDVVGDRFRARPATDRVVRRNGKTVALPPPANRGGLGQPGGDGADAGNETITAAPAETVAEEADIQIATGDEEVADPNLIISGGIIDPTERCPRPVPIGVSAFNGVGGSFAGTLGCRCIDSAGTQYILSNSHVFSREGLASIGEPILQPSPGDGGIAGDEIANLVDFQPYFLPSATGGSDFPNGLGVNVMDCALAEVIPGTVAATSPVYGAPSREIATPVLGMRVQKFGRTTAQTGGRLSGLNVIVPVGFGLGVIEFVGQIAYKGDDPSRSLGAPGDSGSLIVTVEDNRPVGLLFAGGGGTTLANPIGVVLNRFGVVIDDGSGIPPNAAGVSGTTGGAVAPLTPGEMADMFLPASRRHSSARDTAEAGAARGK